VIPYSPRQGYVPPTRLLSENSTLCVRPRTRNPFRAAVISSTRKPVYAKQKLSPRRSRGGLPLCLVLLVLLVALPWCSRADSLEDAARALARKVSAVPQRESRFFLSWQNHSSLTDEHSQALKESFTDEFGGASLVEKQESGAPTLQVSVEETPAFYVLIANLPTATGEATRISRLARAARPSAGTSGVPFRLLKELIWQQQEPILDAVETAEDSSKLGALLILGRDSLTLYRRENDRWELQDSKRIPASEKAVRAARGEIRFSLGAEKLGSIVLPDQSCDLTIGEKMELNCRGASRPWRDGMFLASPCDRGVWWLRGEPGDWSVPDRLLLRNPSLPKSAPSAAELDLPGPSLSISTGRRIESDTTVVFNLSTGNYEVYRITLACAN
jgi:hypothetical protein